MGEDDKKVDTYKRYFREAISGIEREVSFYGSADFDAVIFSAKQRALKKRRNLLVAAVFSLFVLSCSVLGGVSYYNAVKAREIIARNTSELVDSIFDEPFMPDVEYSYISESQSVSDWLENLGSNNFTLSSVLSSEETFNF